MKKYIKYSTSASSYLKSGAVHSSTLEAESIEKLNEKKLAFIEKGKDHSEVITFGVVIKTITDYIPNTDETHYFVEETTNEYLMSIARPLKGIWAKYVKENEK